MEDGSVSPFEPCRVSLGAAWHRENQLPSRELEGEKKEKKKKEKRVLVSGKEIIIIEKKF